MKYIIVFGFAGDYMYGPPRLLPACIFPKVANQGKETIRGQVAWALFLPKTYLSFLK
jgi:hypothetical protein